MDKHVIYLTRDHVLEQRPKGSKSLNTFVFNENGANITSSWTKKNIDNNQCSFIVLDQNNAIQNSCGQGLTQRNYFIESIDFGNIETALKINPFNLVKEPNELHFIMSNILHIRWDNNDPDINIMIHLIDAFASAVYLIFRENNAKQNMEVLVKMAQSIKCFVRVDEDKVPIYQALFENSKDPNWLPTRYYNKFIEETSERKEEVAQKVLEFFDDFSKAELNIMSITDASIVPTFNFKTAYFINFNNSSELIKAKTILFLLMTLIKQSSEDPNLLIIFSNLNSLMDIIDLPSWIKLASTKDIDFLLISNDLAEFKKSKKMESVFRTLQNNTIASVLIHKNPILAKYQNTMPTTEEEIEEYRSAECIATVIVPSDKIQEEDEVF